MINSNILFVCLGNICRSPIAHGIALDLVTKYDLDIQIDSAGTSSYHQGQSPCMNSIKIAGQYGIDISTIKSRPLLKSDLNKFDFVIGMDTQNIFDLKDFGFLNPLKLGDFGYAGANVDDPYTYRDVRDLDKIFKMIKSCTQNFFEEKILC